jgi:hypothetical protein
LLQVAPDEVHQLCELIAEDLWILPKDVTTSDLFREFGNYMLAYDPSVTVIFLPFFCVFPSHSTQNFM